MVNLDPHVTDREPSLLKCTRPDLGEVGEGLLTACKTIAEHDGMCMYGCADMIDAKQEEKKAFRLGSAMTYQVCVEEVKEAISAAEDVCACTFSVIQAPELMEGQDCPSTNCRGVLRWLSADEIAEHRDTD